MQPLRIYLGWDPREDEAWQVAAHSILSRAKVPVSITPLKLARFQQHGLMRRPLEAGEYQTTDVISAARQSTEFATSRFLVPFLAHTGIALFMDCDVVCLADVGELAALFDPACAVQVVKHAGLHEGSLAAALKMDGQEQQHYARKNWSSVVLWNCDHEAHRRLTLDGVNGCRGLDLHQFWWLRDAEIGALPPEWNWLCGVQPKPAIPKIAHFTLGGPWLPGWPGAAHDEIYLNERNGSSRHAA